MINNKLSVCPCKPTSPASMKIIKSSLLLFQFLLVSATGQNPAQAPPAQPKGMVALKMDNGDLDPEEVYLVAVTKDSVAFKFNEGDAQPEIKKRAEVDSIFLYDPADYLEALDLYEGRKYAEAMNAFIKVKNRYMRMFPGLPNNPGVMASYYELECLRKLNDLEGLRVALQKFKKGNLTRKVPLQQIEIYLLWDAIRANLNQEALKIVEQYEGKRLPGHQRAQIAYCHGRALEGLSKPPHEILLAYQTAITADAGASQSLVRDAILRSLEILNNDQEVKDAKRTFDESDGQELIRGFTKVMEAAGLCSMFQIQLATGEPLPQKYRHFLSYTPDRIQAIAEGTDTTKKNGDNQKQPEKPKPGEKGK